MRFQSSFDLIRQCENMIQLSLAKQIEEECQKDLGNQEKGQRACVL